MTTRPNSVQDFLTHKTMEKGGSFLKDWKKDGALELYLHTAHIPTAVWSHSWPTIKTLEDKTTREAVNRVFGSGYNCPESEALLKKQYWRGDNGRRDYPPTTACGMCRTLDWTYLQIFDGKLPLEKAMFRVQGDIESETQVIHAGGFVGQLKAEKLSEGAKERLAKAGVSLDWKKASRESCMCKAGYLCVIVKKNAPTEGALITTIASSLGDKMKNAIGDEMARALKTGKGQEHGDPFKRPYLFEWLYDEKQNNPNDKYRVRVYGEVEPPPNIREIITGAPVDVSRELAPMDQAVLRLKMERACLLKGKDAPPWDELFQVKPASEDQEREADAPPDPDAEPDAPSGGHPAAGRVPEVGRDLSPEQQVAAFVAANPGVELYVCEGEGSCGQGSPTAERCVWCGATFDEEGRITLPPAKAAPPPPPKGRSRNAAPKAPPPPAAEDKPKAAKTFKAGF